MSAVKIIAIGDNVCDKYLSRGKMYPGGQCVNTCAYAAANGVPSAYLGKFGSDEVAAYNQKILHELGIDISTAAILRAKTALPWSRSRATTASFLAPTRAASPKSTASTSRRKIWSTSKAST